MANCRVLLHTKPTLCASRSKQVLTTFEPIRGNRPTAIVPGTHVFGIDREGFPHSEERIDVSWYCCVITLWLNSLVHLPHSLC